MNPSSFRRSLPGLFLIFCGVGFALDAANVFNFGNLISTWWPLILIAIGGIGLTTERHSRLTFGIVLLVGCFALLNRLDLLTFNPWKFVWPAILLCVGASMLSNRRSKSPEGSADPVTNIFVAFSGADQRISSKSYTGGTITTLFGGAKIDLRAAEFADTAALNITAAFGGVELCVPRGCEVVVNGMPIFGGVENKTEPTDHPTGKLIVDANVAFGGIEIKN